MRKTGFTYLGILFAVAIMGAVLAAAGTVWHTAQQREKERDLLFVGDQFRNAIGAYYENTKVADNQLKQYPHSLDDLLKDNRFLVTTRWLRKIYIDPMTGKNEWGLVEAPGGGIMGVHSLSEETPLKTGNFRKVDEEFEGKQHYSEWQFVYRGKTVAGASSGAPVPAVQAVPGAPAIPAPGTAPVQNPAAASAPAPASAALQRAQCDNMKRSDATICQAIAQKNGDEAGRLCNLSVEDRYTICTTKGGQGLPPLDVRVQENPDILQ